MEQEAALTVERVGKNATGEPRWIGWASDDVITRRMRPYDGEVVDLANLENWKAYQSDEELEP